MIKKLPLSFSVFSLLLLLPLSLSEMFETLECTIDLGFSDLGPQNLVPFDAVLLRCIDKVLGDVEVVGVGS